MRIKTRLIIIMAMVLIMALVVIFFLLSNKNNHSELNYEKTVQKSNETLSKAPNNSNAVKSQKHEVKRHEPIPAQLATNKKLENEIDQETEKPEAASGIQDSKPEIDQKLKILFSAVKQVIDQNRILEKEAFSYEVEFGKLSQRQIDIGNELYGAGPEKTIALHEEFRNNSQRMKELHSIIDPIDEKRLQLRKALEEMLTKEYGIGQEEFWEMYKDKYESWSSDL